MRPRFLRYLALLAVTALIAVSCSSDEGSTAATDAPDEPAPTDAPAPTEGPTDTTSDGGGEAPPDEVDLTTPTVCSPDGFPDEPVTLTYWAGTEEPSYILEEEMIPLYKEAHPNVEIIHEQWGIFDAFDKLVVDLPAGGGPTTHLMFEPFLEIFHSQGFLDPLIPEAMCEESSQGIIDRYIEGSIDPYIRDGEVIALPIQRNSWSFFINNRIFEEAGLDPVADAPQTWADIAELNELLTVEDDSGRVVQKGFEYRYTAGNHWMAMAYTGMVYQLGGDVVNPDGSPAFNSPEGVEAMTQWSQNVVAPEVSNNVGPSPYQDFADELVAMAFGGPNALQFMYTLNPELEGNVTVVSMPQAGDQYEGGMSYGFALMLNSNASDAEKYVASNFIDFLTSAPNLWFERTGMLQPRTGWSDQSAAASFTGLPVFVDDIADSRPLPQIQTWGPLQTALAAAIQRVAFDGQDPAAALEQAEAEYLQSIGS